MSHLSVSLFQVSPINQKKNSVSSDRIGTRYKMTRLSIVPLPHRGKGHSPAVTATYSISRLRSLGLAKNVRYWDNLFTILKYGRTTLSDWLSVYLEKKTTWRTPKLKTAMVRLCNTEGLWCWRFVTLEICMLEVSDNRGFVTLKVRDAGGFVILKVRDAKGSQ